MTGLATTSLWELAAFYGRVMARKSQEARDLLEISTLNMHLCYLSLKEAALQGIEAQNRLGVIIRMRCPICHESMKLTQEDFDPIHTPNQKTRTWRCGCCHRRYQDAVIIDGKGHAMAIKEKLKEVV